jgi:hypothetical protein
MADRVVGLARVVARDHLQRTAEQAAGSVDLVDREFPGFAVRHQELRDRRVAVDFADADGLACGRLALRVHGRKHGTGCRGGEHLPTLPR